MYTILLFLYNNIVWSVCFFFQVLCCFRFFLKSRCGVQCIVTTAIHHLIQHGPSTTVFLTKSNPTKSGLVLKRWCERSSVVTALHRSRGKHFWCISCKIVRKKLGLENGIHSYWQTQTILLLTKQGLYVNGQARLEIKWSVLTKRP